LWRREEAIQSLRLLLHSGPSPALRAERKRLRRGFLRHPSTALRTGSEAVPLTKKRLEDRDSSGGGEEGCGAGEGGWGGLG